MSVYHIPSKSTNSKCTLSDIDGDMDTRFKRFHLNASENRLISRILVSRFLRVKHYC